MLASVFEGFPPVKGIRKYNVTVLVATPILGLYGLIFARPYETKTVVFALLYYLFSVIGITAGYHRLWSHRSYNASLPLQVFLLLGATSAVQGSCRWWSRAHRSHHRHTDTDLDPYNSKRGLLWTHIGWMVVKTNLYSGPSDITDLRNNKLIQWQHRWYFALHAIFGFTIPSALPGFLWGDWIGGICLSGALRLAFVHHSVFSVNSIAHYIGDAPYDDRLTPRDHLISAIVTLGEGYHNFHHQFPMDYRNAFRWYQYDPTKWFIATCRIFGLATHLRVFPSNEIEKGALTMKLKELKEVQDSLRWPKTSTELPVVSWETFQKESSMRTLILISGFIHDASSFLDQHPGGKHMLTAASGKDVTASFFGGVYSHSNAAHNLLAMQRVGILYGGVEGGNGDHNDAISPAQKLVIVENTTI